LTHRFAAGNSDAFAPGWQSHAAQGLTRGAADEIVPRESLLPRAWELAHYLKKQNALTLRYTR
jgi:hypothetical protein